MQALSTQPPETFTQSQPVSTRRSIRCLRLSPLRLAHTPTTLATLVERIFSTVTSNSPVLCTMTMVCPSARSAILSSSLSTVKPRMTQVWARLWNLLSTPSFITRTFKCNIKNN
ncbi:MAG: hypothetical protein [Cressdnaviricota sp.]|nr:MAG: hypothetical protein [Cressdnaviricota sp.]